MTFTYAIFLFFFFPFAFLLYQVIPGSRAKNIFLAVIGLVFYAFGQIRGLPLLLLSVAVNYGAGLLVGRTRWKKPVLVLAVVLDLLILGCFKYLDLFIGGVNGLFALDLPLQGWLQPLGISFFTFKGISYVVDAYRSEDRASRSFLEVLLYISFFPQVTAGPITRFADFRGQLTDRSCCPEGVAWGLRRFIVGFAKKLLIAVPVSAIADAAFGGMPDIRLAWLGAVAYTVQIYFDFSGYSDMAIGLGAIFGFQTPENFNYPYIAASITDFWRRWHISLSSWFRDYLYIPLGGSRRGKLRTGVNKALVFLFCGFWHGANWTFLLWGAWHGFFSLLESSTPLDVRRVGGTRAGRILGHVYTLLVACLGFVIFRAASFAEAAEMFRALFTGFAPIPAATLAVERITPASWAALAVGVLASTPVAPKLSAWADRRGGGVQMVCTVGSYVLTLGLFVLCLLAASGSGFQPFIYAQF